MLKDEIMTLDNPFVTWGIEQGLEQGFQKGRQEGRQEGEVALVLRLLRRRFGRVSASQEALIKKLSGEKLEELGEALLDFKTVEQFDSWLKQFSA